MNVPVLSSPFPAAPATARDRETLWVCVLALVQAGGFYAAEAGEDSPSGVSALDAS